MLLKVFIRPAMGLSSQILQRHEVPASQLDFHFKGLQPVTQYNVTVHGMGTGKRLWPISNVFSTTDITVPSPAPFSQ